MLIRTALAAVLLAGLAAWPASARAAGLDELYFSDDFSAASGQHYFFEGELERRHFSYVDGQYEIDTRDGSAYGQSVLVEDLSTFRAETTGRLLESSDSTGGGFGLTFNYRERQDAAGSDFLLFLCYNRGAYTVLRYLDGQTTVLLTPTKTRLFQPSETVTLTVDAAEGRLVFYINGAEVGRLAEDYLISGGLGMFCTASSVARFDEFKIYAQSAGEVAPSSASFSDDFAGQKRLFEGDFGEVSYRYEDGRYVIDTRSTSYIGLSPFPKPATDFELQVDVELLSGDPVGGFGLYLRDWPNDSGGYNQFRFLISGNWFAIEQSVDDRPLALAQWTQHEAVLPGGVNRLKVRAQDGELTFWVNGVQVYTHTDERPHQGSFGFFVSAGLQVAFDNAQFTEL